MTTNDHMTKTLHCPSRKRLSMCTCQLLKRKVIKRISPVWLSSILRATLELLGDASGLISLVLVFNPLWSVSTSRFGIVKWRLGAGLSLLSPAVFGLDSLLWTFWEKSASITKTTNLQQLPALIFSWWRIATKKLDLLLRIIPVIRLMALIAWPHLETLNIIVFVFVFVFAFVFFFFFVTFANGDVLRSVSDFLSWCFGRWFRH